MNKILHLYICIFFHIYFKKKKLVNQNLCGLVYLASYLIKWCEFFRERIFIIIIWSCLLYWLDVRLVTVLQDVLPILHTLSSASWRQGRPCNISGFQLLPLEPATTTQHPPFPSSSHQVKDGVAAPADEVKVVERGSSASPSPATHSARGLIADTLLVLQAALTDVLQADGNIFLHARNDDGDTEQRQEKSMKCTSFVVDKKEHGDTLMDALRVVSPFVHCRNTLCLCVSDLRETKGEKDNI